MNDTLPTLLAEHDQVPFLCGPAMGDGRFLRADELAQKMGLDTTTSPFTVLARRMPTMKVAYEAVALSLHRAFADFLASKGWEMAGWTGSHEARTYASLYSGGVDAFYLACRRLGPLRHRLAAEKNGAPCRPDLRADAAAWDEVHFQRRLHPQLPAPRGRSDRYIR